MAIYWVDPYLNSPNGGIHGTTSSGGGTYASPWTFADLANSTTMGALASGDEIRFKGLAEDTFFDTNAAFTSVNGTGTTTNYYSFGTTLNKLIRLKAQNGTIYYSAMNASQLKTGYGVSTWDSANPLQYPGYGYYICNANYYITTGPNARLFPGLTQPVTITSGWTSETVRDGVTVIVAASTTPFGSTFYFGDYDTVAQTKLTIDCPEMIIATLNSSTGLTIAANSVKLKSAMLAEYYPAGYFRIYSGRTSSTAVGSGTLELESCSTGTWCDFYSYGVSSGTTNVSIGLSTVGYQPKLYLNATSGSTPSFNLTLKNLHSYYNWYLGCGAYNVTWNAPTGWAYEWKTGQSFYGFSSAVITENFGTPAPQMFSNTIYNSFAYVSTPATNASPTTVAVGTKLYSTAGSYLKKASISSAYKSWASRLIIETLGDTLDTLSATPASCTAVCPYGSPYKVNILVEPVTKKRVQLMGPTTTGDVAAVFNSPTNSDKLTWRLFGSSNGKVYADTFGLPMPTYGANGLQFDASFTTTSSPGITMAIKIYGTNTTNASSVIAHLQTITPTVSGTSITASYTIPESVLTSNSIGNLFAVVDVTKTSGDTCSLYFNSMSVTAL